VQIWRRLYPAQLLVQTLKKPIDDAT
jgi:hypothetical protein